MKRLFIAPALGACALLMIPACTSTDGDGYTTETALPMSEVADGEIPPWLLEDDGTNGAHVDAGPRTPSLADAARNAYAIPEPTETPSGAVSQNQPALGAADDSIVETPVTAGTDPLLSTGLAVPGTVNGTGTITATTATTSKTTDSSTKSGTKSSSSSGKKSGSKGGKKPKQPTMVVYKVRAGDNLSDIAKRSNTTVAQIMRDSNLKSTTIHPGQTIKVRFTPKGYKAGTSTKGSSAKSSGKTHTITSGQTLSGIAARYGVTTSQLMKANGLTAADAKKIRPGQKLTIPSKR